MIISLQSGLFLHNPMETLRKRNLLTIGDNTKHKYMSCVTDCKYQTKPDKKTPLGLEVRRPGECW